MLLYKKRGLRASAQSTPLYSGYDLPFPPSSAMMELLESASAVR